VFEATTRPLRGDERERLTLRRAELERRVAAEAREQARGRRGSALIIFGVSGFFLAIAGFNLVWGSRSAMFAALLGAVVHAAIAFFVGRPYEHSFAERRELERIHSALSLDTVQVYALIADAAIVLHEPGDEHAVVGYLFRVGATEVVHVEREHCGSLDLELLPTTHLHCERIAGLGVTVAQAQGERLEPLQRCPLEHPGALEPLITAQLMAYPTTLEQLARHLTRGS